MSLSEALNIAYDSELDLVMVGGNNELAICIIVDYSKLLYNKHKSEKANNKHKQEVKEIHLRPLIATNDLKTKARTLDRILKEGDKTKVVINYRGREVQYIKDGISLIERFIEMITSKYTIEKQAKIEGNKVYLILAPVK